MLNAYYDINTGTNLTPFITMGAGASHIHTSDADYYIGDPQVTLPGLRPFIENDYHINFTFQVGAGISYKITSKFALDLEYKYLYMGKLEYEARNKYYYEYVDIYKMENMVMHKVQIGARYMF